MTSYAGEVVEEVPGGVRLVATWERTDLELGYVRFERGDRFIEWFYRDRWYSIFEVHSGATAGLKGWYCNVATPATITSDEITCRDLLLDLWVSPDGTMRVLDEDEFDADTGLDEDLQRRAREALGQLQALACNRIEPFDKITPDV